MYIVSMLAGSNKQLQEFSEFIVYTSYVDGVDEGISKFVT